jgi:hypothetical protein
MRMGGLLAAAGIAVALWLQGSRWHAGDALHAAGSSPPPAVHAPGGTNSPTPWAASDPARRPDNRRTASIPAGPLDDAGLRRHQAWVLNTAVGQADIAEVVSGLGQVIGGPDVQLYFETLALRKQEALPWVKDGLRNGGAWEKFVLTKFQGVCPWPETLPELATLATATGETWLPRQGALYALGALGDASVGPQILGILSDPGCPAGVRLIAISTLARVGYQPAASHIRPFTNDEDAHVRLFAFHALAELGQPVDATYLFAALDKADYVIRQEACEALGCIPGEQVRQRLALLAAGDPHEAVRDAATQALLRREIAGRAPSEKLAILSAALGTADRHVADWILQTLSRDCGDDGRSVVLRRCAGEDYIGQRSLTLLTLAASR